MTQLSPVLLFCGRYEGVDERVRDLFDQEISIGDFVLNGGEVGAWAIIEAVSRLLPGVLGNEASTVEESFSGGLLEYPQYTRPEISMGKRVPSVLLSGDHARIARWRRGQSLLRTREKRPDLFAKLELSDDDRAILLEAEQPDEPQTNARRHK
jgi:tRNA (guanine37-N1)-methyltransferase